jgi:hypothetical protein
MSEAFCVQALNMRRRVPLTTLHPFCGNNPKFPALLPMNRETAERGTAFAMG